MKRKFTFLIAAALMLLTMMATTGRMWGQTRDDVTLQYTGSTTTNMTGENDAATLGLSATDWSVVGYKGGQKYYPGLNKDGTIRLYAGGTGETGNGAYIVVTNSNDNTITSITMNVKSGTATVLVGGNSVTGTNNTYTINSTSFTVKNQQNSGQVQINSITINYSSGSGSTPSISANDVNIAYNATQGSIAYTINNGVEGGELTASVPANSWITLGDVADDAVPFTCAANTENNARTETVTLTYTYNTNETVTKDVTVTQAAAPIVCTTIPELFAAATSVGNTATSATITLNNWVVSGVSSNSKNVFVTDGTNGFVIFDNGGDMGFTTGNILSGTVSCKVQLYNGFAEITQLNSQTSGISITTGGTVTAAEIEMANLTGVNTGALLHYDNLTCNINNNRYYLSDGTTELQVYNALYAFDALEDGKIYNITGVYQQYTTSNNDTKEILPRSADDIEEVVSTEPTITVANATVNIGAEGGDGTLTVTYENFTDIAADVYFCDAQGEAAQYDWIVAEINTDNNVDYIIGANDGAARTAYLKVYALDDQANYVYSNLITINQDEYVAPTYAALPFAFNGVRADIEDIDGLYQEGLGSDYSASTSPNTKLKFDTTNDWLLLQFEERPGTLTFSIKNNSFSEGTFKVQTSVDGTTFEDLKIYTDEVLIGTLNEEFTELNENIRYIKWIYTDRQSGNVGLGNIALAQYTVPVPSISADDVAVAYDATSGSIMYTINNYVAGTMVATTEADWISDFTYNQVDEIGEVGFTTAANTGAERSATVTLTYTYDNSKATVTKDVTVTQNGTPSITVTPATANVAFAGGTPEFTVTYESLSIEDSDDFDVAFYETSTSTTSITKPEWITSAVISGNTTDGFTLTTTVAANDGAARNAYLKVYALDENTEPVYSGLVTISQAEHTQLATYSLVTSVDDIVSGKHYIIASSATNGAAFAMGGQTTNNRSGVAVTIENGQIAETENVYEFVINTHESSSKDVVYTIYDAVTPGYLYASSSSGNQLKTTTNLNDNGRWTIEFSATGKATIIAQGSNTRNVMRYNPNNNNPIFACYASTSTTGNLPCIYVKDNDTDYEYYGTEITYTETSIPDGETITIGTGSVMTVTNNFGNDNPAALVIEDGGQLVFDGTGVQATMKKSTAHANTGSKDAADWYTIASPLAANVAPSAVGNLTSSAYDLYRYNEGTATWENQNNPAHAADFTELEVGRGYLYWNTNGDELEFAGELRNADVNYTLKADADGDAKGFNLIGNPFSQNITMSNITGATLPGGYVLTKAGAWKTSVETTIAPCQGFLVQVDGEKDIIISKSIGSKSRANRDYIAFTVANDQYEDVTYAMFEEGLGLNKINHRNSDIPMVYIPQDGQNYAIATMSDETQSFNLNFKAMTTGKYTLSYKAEGKYDYLHVIDRITGEDVDMLLDGEYSFMASAGDNDARFIVKLRYDANGNFDSDIFAYQNGNDVIVNGEGELQMFDLTGRMVANTMVNGVQTVNVPTQGVYIFRLVGNDVKTQKIVVR